MSLNTKGNAALTIQPGAKVTENDDGTLTGVAVWEGGAENLASAPRIGSPHPFNQKLECTSYELEGLTLGRARYTASYFGISNDTRRVSYTAGVASEDIQLHSDFEKFAGTPKNPIGGARWLPKVDPESGEVYYEWLGFFNGENGADGDKDSLVGTNNYLSPSGTVEVSYYTSREPKMKRLATIHNKVKGWRKPEGIKNLLLTDMPYRQIGRSHYQVTETYLASDEKGWNPKLYKSAK